MRLLSGPPGGVGQIGTAARPGLGLADRLHAAVATNPLPKVEGTVLDPRQLFVGPDPATIAAVREILAASGGIAADIGKLGTGEFDFATQRSGRPVKLRTPLCHERAWPNVSVPVPDERTAALRADHPRSSRSSRQP